MENALIDETNIPVEITELRDSESADEFQKFIHNLFENNGVLNDLRAYLRGHIVNVLQKAEKGESLCQKNFTQRLELTFQAMNILIAEYLLRLEFKYTLSVFTSEIPLSNMVFKFANALLKSTDSALSGLRFGENDIWSILNYLGIKCDSEHASKIVEVYKNQADSSLLWCILKCIPMYQKPKHPKVNSSEESQSCSAKSDDSLENIANNPHTGGSNKCEHFTFCKSCQSRVSRLREKYKRKKIKVDENSKSMEVNNLNVPTFMQNIGILEKSMIDEMFQQLKTVYDAEMDMIRDEKEKKIKRSIANHALQLQKYREELEQSFCARRSELTHNAQRRQRFLCELARRLALAQKHLAQEEEKLKIQMQEAEKTLVKKGEEMRHQISDELAILQSHLETVKREREDINRERMELDNLKQIYNNINILKERNSKENEDIISNYNLLRDEVVTLRKYIEANKLSTCLVERGTVTDFGDGAKSMMNNENAGGCISDDERLKVNQVVNDLKKRKNVNFNQSNIEDPCGEVNRQRSSMSTDIRSEIDNVTIQQLRDENERLKIFSRQQAQLIGRLARERPRAPLRVDRVPDELGVQSRVLVPGDTVPFIGVVGNRQRDDNRRVLNQWRSLSRQPVADIHVQPNTSTIITENTEVSSKGQTEEKSQHDVCEKTSLFKVASPVNSKIQEKSSKSVTKEAKQTLRDKTVLSSAVSDKSSDATIREAKLRLRKLEIEAEAVEKSYLDYRIRQTELSKERTNSILDDVKKIGTKKTNSLEKLDANSNISDKFVYKGSPEAIKKDFDKYFKEYQRTNDKKSHIQNVYSVIEKIKPIPEYYLHKNENESNNINYLETPLMEFRKLYQSQKPKINKLNNYNHLNTEMDTSEQAITPNVKKVTSDTQTDSNIQPENSDENVDTHKANLPFGNEIDIPKNINEKQIKILEDNFDNKQNLQELYTDNIEDFEHETFKVNETKLPLKIDNQKPEAGEKNKTHDEVVIEMNEHKSNVEVEKENFVKAIEIIEQKTNKEIEHEEIKKEIKNLLMVEVENVCASTNIKVTESDQDLLVVVQSSVDSKELGLPEIDKEQISTQMTILVSPKSDIREVEDKTNNLSPEITKLRDNDALNSIYHTDVNLMSSTDMPLDLNKIDFIGDIERGSPDYPDDFSADVDNYNSQSDYGKNSPISLPKTSEDDSFWD
ncbi:repetitive organellar protein-like isoform X2 [Vanessa atalanta]|uniref:repetitive organellar protein-like isoform X2 n=1 Tax=Vanessa atalanta TaxID=42275 RepID=UPI001FCD97D5|nr:repetitive organellar protein-like isoform X2 [Vanessa atalanta]